jgi:protein-tyrosine-phosphatase
MAEGILQSKLPEDLKDKAIVVSAGTLGLDGNPATEFAIAAASQYGADISDHRSQGATDELLQDADIIFAMSSEHKHYLDHYYPEIRENVFLLKTFGRDHDLDEKEIDDSIDDPIGRSLEFYQQCCEVINSELERIMPRLEQMIREYLSRGNV